MEEKKVKLEEMFDYWWNQRSTLIDRQHVPHASCPLPLSVLGSRSIFIVFIQLLFILSFIIFVDWFSCVCLINLHIILFLASITFGYLSFLVPQKPGFSSSMTDNGHGHQHHFHIIWDQTENHSRGGIGLQNGGLQKTRKGYSIIIKWASLRQHTRKKSRLL